MFDAGVVSCCPHPAFRPIADRLPGSTPSVRRFSAHGRQLTDLRLFHLWMTEKTDRCNCDASHTVHHCCLPNTPGCSPLSTRRNFLHPQVESWVKRGLAGRSTGLTWVFPTFSTGAAQQQVNYPQVIHSFVHIWGWRVPETSPRFVALPCARPRESRRQPIADIRVGAREYNEFIDV